jgi:hypothetical protein
VKVFIVGVIFKPVPPPETELAEKLDKDVPELTLVVCVHRQSSSSDGFTALKVPLPYVSTVSARPYCVDGLGFTTANERVGELAFPVLVKPVPAFTEEMGVGPLEAAETRPLLSTVMDAYVYEPAPVPKSESPSRRLDCGPLVWISPFVPVREVMGVVPFSACIIRPYGSTFKVEYV